jgi:alkanesulfonate monooxygenase SsuD/methylene tetrahydromethanopterin reductase-like flavin-dependent oxidoreductase (luciferase family)
VLTRLGLALPSLRSTGSGCSEDFSQLAASARVAERSGFDSLFFCPASESAGSTASVGSGFEAYTFLGALARRTSSARIGTLGLDRAGRPPSLLAKQITALDVLSSGRAVLGIGEAGGGPDAVERLEETIDICRAMFRESPVDFDGRFHSLLGATNRPRPVQEGGPPIVIDARDENPDSPGLAHLVSTKADGVFVAGDLAEVAAQVWKFRPPGSDTGPLQVRLSVILLASLVLSDSQTKAQRIAGELLADGLIDRKKYTLIAGDQGAVTARVGEYRRAGVDGIVVQLPDVLDLRHVEMAGEVLGRALVSDAGRG